MFRVSLLLLSAVSLADAFSAPFLAARPGLKTVSTAGLTSPLPLRTSRSVNRAGSLALAAQEDIEFVWTKKNSVDSQAALKEGYTYLDVRSDGEFENGHPPGAVNIPAFAVTDEGPLPMASTFVMLVQENYPDKSEKLVVGCQSGRRSTAACKWLTEVGYTNIIENEEGFGGWAAAGLPVE